MTDGAVGVGAGQDHQHIGTSAEGAPRLDAVDEVALDAVDRRGRGRDGHARHVRAVVGLGHRDRVHDLGRRQLGQPFEFLFLGAARLEGAGEDFRTGDERTTGAEGAPREFLGGDHHGDVIGVGAGREPAVLLGDRQPEGAHLRETFDDLLGDVAVGAVDVLGDRLELLIREAPEGVLHHLEVVGEVAGALLTGEGGQELGLAIRRHE